MAPRTARCCPACYRINERVQRLTESFLGSSPECLAASGAADRASQQLPEDAQEAIVKPDDGVYARPDDGSRSAVVAIEDPTVASRRFLHCGQERLIRRFLPIWLPEQGIDLDVVESKLLSQPSSDRGFARARRPYNVDTRTGPVTFRPRHSPLQSHSMTHLGQASSSSLMGEHAKTRGRRFAEDATRLQVACLQPSHLSKWA